MSAAKKVKKRLAFLKKAERNKLIECFKLEKKNNALNFSHVFYSVYQDYIKHFPTRQSVFSIAVTLPLFISLTELLLDKILDIFVQFGKKTNKFAQLQLAWYHYTGKVLNGHTNTIVDQVVANLMSKIQKQCNTATQTDKRVFLSCVMKALIDYFLKLTHELKSKQQQNKAPRIYRKINFDNTSLYKIVGALLRQMIKKRQSLKYVKRLSPAKQTIVNQEIHILKAMCLSNEEKEKVKHMLPVGFNAYDRGNLLVIHTYILNFVRVLAREISTTVNTAAYAKLGSNMAKVAKLKLASNKGLKVMFCSCVRKVTGCDSTYNNAVLNVHKEFSSKTFNTMMNEFIKRDKFLGNNTAQLMLRDKLKFYANKKQLAK